MRTCKLSTCRKLRHWPATVRKRNFGGTCCGAWWVCFAPSRYWRGFLGEQDRPTAVGTKRGIEREAGLRRRSRHATKRQQAEVGVSWGNVGRGVPASRHDGWTFLCPATARF